MSTSLDLIDYRVGDTVREHGGRHLAKVLSIEGVVSRVQWIETGWTSRLPALSLTLVERALTTTAASYFDTVVESPRHKLQRELQERRRR